VFTGKKRMGAERTEGNGSLVFQYFVFVQVSCVRVDCHR